MGLRVAWNKGKKWSKEHLEKLRVNMVDNTCEICGNVYKIKKSHLFIKEITGLAKNVAQEEQL